MFKNNVGNLDRMIRYFLALVSVIVAIVIGPFSGWSIALYALATMLVVTGTVGFCGIYALFGVNTCPCKTN